MRIGLFGGSFNPIHKGHLYIARKLHEQLSLDKVWLLPAGFPPHKSAEQGSSRFQRLDMCRIAIQDAPFLEICTYEMEQESPSYTYLTLTALKQQHPDDHFFFLLGEDSLFTFEIWRHPEIIAAHTDIVVAARHGGMHAPAGLPAYDIAQKAQELSETFHTTFHILQTDYVDVSSSQIRMAAAQQEDFSGQVTEGVYRYIKAHRLYEQEEEAMSPKNNGKNNEKQKRLLSIEKEIEKNLKPSRMEHTRGVMYTAASLAMRYGYPVDDALLAGLLHDCAKYMSGEKLLSFAKKKKLPITPAEMDSPQLLHAKAGAWLAKKEYGIKDDAILHAIEVHTTGAPGMSLLDEIVFVADYIEPNRNQAPRLAEIRTAAFRDLPLAIRMILSDTLAYLEKNHVPIDDTTRETYEFYRNHTNQKGALL